MHSVAVVGCIDCGLGVEGIEAGLDLDERREVVLEQGHLVQGEGIARQRLAALLHLQHRARLDGIVAAPDGLEGLVDVVGRDVGQKAQTPRVDAEDGHLAATHLGRRRQERTVAADGDGQVGIQRLDGEHAGKGYVDVQILPQKTAEGLLHTHFGSQLPQLIYNLPDIQILFHLIDVTKKGYAHRNGAF